MIAISVQFAEPSRMDAEMVELAARYLTTFADAANLGALAGDSIEPARSGLVVGATTTTAAAMHWEFERCAVHPCALLVLVNMMHCFHAHCAPVHSLSIESDILERVDFERIELPDAFEPLPFQVDVEAEGPDIMVEVEFAGEVPEQAAAEYCAAWQTWLDLASFGAFADQVFPPDRNEIYEANDPMVVPGGIEFALESVFLDLQAFDALTNVFHRLHRSAAPLTSVRYE
jgi:hypothetical protein